MHPAIGYALFVQRAINNQEHPTQWARLDIQQFEDEKIPPIVQMQIGSISYDGVKQVRLVTRSYYVFNGVVKWVDHAHS